MEMDSIRVDIALALLSESALMAVVKGLHSRKSVPEV